MRVGHRGSDGFMTPAQPIGPQGFVAKAEFWLRGKGFKTIPTLLARWDERKLGK